jgi:hypothetical protein
MTDEKAIHLKLTVDPATPPENLELLRAELADRVVAYFPYLRSAELVDEPDVRVARVLEKFIYDRPAVAHGPDLGDNDA